jgi:alpha/beta superfamily hydrolase
VAVLREACHLEQVALAGYSFGALVALNAGHDHAHVDRLIAIAPPLTMFDTTFLGSCVKPKLFLLGDHDQYCPYSALEQLDARLAGTNVLHRLTGEDHFLAGAGDRIGRAVVEFLQSA